MPMPTSPATEARAAARRGGQDGFALIELMLALAIVSLLAALALPTIRPGGGALAARMEAMRTASFLRAERNAALTSGRRVVARLDLGRRRVLSGGSGGPLELSRALTLTARPAGLGDLAFSPDGRSTGGRLDFGTPGSGFAVVVNPATAAVQVEAF